jgi:hypothetical protein
VVHGFLARRFPAVSPPVTHDSAAARLEKGYGVCLQRLYIISSLRDLLIQNLKESFNKQV